MAIALVGSGQGFSTNNNGFTTSAFDTTGADFLIAVYGGASGSFTISDSKSNTWTALTQGTHFFGIRACQIFYAFNATTGTGHTFTISGTGNEPTLCLMWFSGVLLTDPFDAGSDIGANVESTTVSPGSDTPSTDGCLVIGGLHKIDATAVTINGGFTIPQQTTDTNTGHHWGAEAYLIQTTAAAAAPTWSCSVTQFMAARQAVFKPAAGGGGGSLPRSLVIGQAVNRASTY